jgi:hypothetical protein
MKYRICVFSSDNRGVFTAGSYFRILFVVVVAVIIISVLLWCHWRRQSKALIKQTLVPCGNRSRGWVWVGLNLFYAAQSSPWPLPSLKDCALFNRKWWLPWRLHRRHSDWSRSDWSFQSAIDRSSTGSMMSDEELLWLIFVWNLLISAITLLHGVEFHNFGICFVDTQCDFWCSCMLDGTQRTCMSKWESYIREPSIVLQLRTRIDANTVRVERAHSLMWND